MFRHEIAQALDWLDNSPREEEGENDYYPQYGWRDGYLTTELALAMYGNMDNLRRAMARLDAVVEQGMAMQGSLVVALNQKADAVEEALVLRVVQFEAQYQGGRGLLDTWFGPELTAELDAAQKAVSYDLANFRIQEGSLRLEAAEQRLAASLQEARDMEYKHQKRLYVLKCLRQVCRALGKR